jgi:ABC-type nitrate/sulfonate/bicarbonate transport system substrate-binding protein
MKRTTIFLVLLLSLSLVISSCARQAAPPQAQDQQVLKDTSKELSQKQVKFATISRDAQELMIVYSMSDMFFPKVGFTEKPEVVLTEETLPGLTSGQVWVAMDETSTIWAAMDEGNLDLVIVAVDKDNEERILGARPGIKTAQDLSPESKISGGAVGEYDELILREILTNIGVDPNNVQIIAMGGGADARMKAMIAGQLDAGIQQPRNIAPLTEAGGVILYNQPAEAVQDTYVVTRDYLNQHRDEVCAFVKAEVMSKQWAYEGADHKANLQPALDIVKKYSVDPTENELAGWVHELEGNISLDGGATVAALDKFQKDLKSLEVLSADFQWRDHADFSCLWEAQQALGLQQRPEKQ